MERFSRVQPQRREVSINPTRSSVHRPAPVSIESPVLPFSASERAASPDRAGEGRHTLRWSITRLPITRDEQVSVRQDATSASGTWSVPSQGSVLQRRPLELATHEQNPASLPSHLKTRIESLSGLSLDDVRVHYHSVRPLRVGAAAYAQGRDIYLAPDQQEYLAHEAWHVVQQKQARVRPTVYSAGAAINDDRSLEREADLMGIQGEQAPGQTRATGEPSAYDPAFRQGQAAASSALAPSTAGQAVMQLMKLNALPNAKSFVDIRNGGRVLDLKNGFHVTVYANQTTWNLVMQRPKVNGRFDFTGLKQDEFEFDGLHVTYEGGGLGGEKKHFYYDAQGKPLQNYSVKYGEEEIIGSSPPWDDAGWKLANSIVAEQLGTDKYAIHERFNAAAGKKYFPESAQDEREIAEKPKQQQKQLFLKQQQLLAAKKKTQFQSKPMVRTQNLLSLPGNVSTQTTNPQETGLPQQEPVSTQTTISQETELPQELVSTQPTSSQETTLSQQPISTQPTISQESSLPQENIATPPVVSTPPTPLPQQTVSTQPRFNFQPITLQPGNKRKYNFKDEQ